MQNFHDVMTVSIDFEKEDEPFPAEDIKKMMEEQKIHDDRISSVFENDDEYSHKYAMSILKNISLTDNIDELNEEEYQKQKKIVKGLGIDFPKTPMRLILKTTPT